MIGTGKPARRVCYFALQFYSFGVLNSALTLAMFKLSFVSFFVFFSVGGSYAIFFLNDLVFNDLYPHG